MKFSIVVPTCARVATLRSTLATCQAQTWPDFEIVVSDNFSNDGTGEAVRSLADSRIRYVNTGRRLGMRENFEFALSHVTGDYVLYIGDDDGLLPEALEIIAAHVRATGADVVNWTIANYIWPAHDGDLGRLRIKQHGFHRGYEFVNPSEILERFRTARFRNYKIGANIYHGAVSMEIINKIRNKSGAYFRSISPDVYACIANLVFCRNMIHVHHPVSLNGRSNASIGWLAQQYTDSGRHSDEVIKKLVGEYGENVEKTVVDMRLHLVTGHVMDALILVKNHLLDEKFSIDYSAWINRLIHETNRLPADVAERDMVHVREMASALNVPLPSPSLTKMKSEKSLLRQATERILNPTFREFRDRRLRTVHGASMFLSRFAGALPRIRRTDSVTTFGSIIRWVLAHVYEYVDRGLGLSKRRHFKEAAYIREDHFVAESDTQSSSETILSIRPPI